MQRSLPLSQLRADSLWQLLQVEALCKFATQVCPKTNNHTDLRPRRYLVVMQATHDSSAATFWLSVQYCFLFGLLRVSWLKEFVVVPDVSTDSSQAVHEARPITTGVQISALQCSSETVSLSTPKIVPLWDACRFANKTIATAASVGLV